MRHGLSGLSTYGLNGHRKGDEHAAYVPVGYGTFTFTFISNIGYMYKKISENVYML